MRNFSPFAALGVVLLVGSSGFALAQNQAQNPAQSQGAAPSTGASPTANERQQHAPNPRHQAKKMARELGLSPDQQTKIEPILADRDQQMQSVRSDASLAPQDRRAKVHGIRQDSDSRIEAVLTDAQKQQYEQIKLSRKARKQAAGTASTI